MRNSRSVGASSAPAARKRLAPRGVLGPPPDVLLGCRRRRSPALRQRLHLSDVLVGVRTELLQRLRSSARPRDGRRVEPPRPAARRRGPTPAAFGGEPCVVPRVQRDPTDVRLGVAAGPFRFVAPAAASRPTNAGSTSVCSATSASDPRQLRVGTHRFEDSDGLRGSERAGGYFALFTEGMLNCGVPVDIGSSGMASPSRVEPPAGGGMGSLVAAYGSTSGGMARAIGPSSS